MKSVLKIAVGIALGFVLIIFILGIFAYLAEQEERRANSGMTEAEKLAAEIDQTLKEFNRDMEESKRAQEQLDRELRQTNYFAW